MEPDTQPVRADRWLWAVRLYRTRSLAAAACRGGRVAVDGVDIKPSRLLKLGCEIKVDMGDLTRHVKVIGLLGKRVGAKMVADFMEDLTTQEARDKAAELRAQRRAGAPNPGAGRPTKRQRRQLQAFLDKVERARGRNGRL